MAMASMRVRPMTIDDATCVSSWRYPDRWSVYDLQSSTDILDELDLYRSVTDANGTFIGFFCQESAARAHGMSADPGIVDVGVGMDSRLVGQGSGRAFGEVVLDHLARKHPGRPLRAVIQSWNLRSGRFAATLGFVDVGELASLGLTPFGGHRLSGLVGRCGDPVLEGYRRDLAERAVAPAVVVDGVDPGADGVDRLGFRRELVPLVELGFQRRPEALLLGVVPTHPSPSHREPDVRICFIQRFNESLDESIPHRRW